jgi:hypothetical protein
MGRLLFNTCTQPRLAAVVRRSFSNSAEMAGVGAVAAE